MNSQTDQTGLTSMMLIDHDEEREPIMQNVSTTEFMDDSDSDEAALLMEDKRFVTASNPLSTDDDGVKPLAETSEESNTQSDDEDDNDDAAGSDSSEEDPEEEDDHFDSEGPLLHHLGNPSIGNTGGNLPPLNEDSDSDAMGSSPVMGPISDDADEDEVPSHHFPSLRFAKDRAKKALDDAKRRVATSRLQKQSELFTSEMNIANGDASLASITFPSANPGPLERMAQGKNLDPNIIENKKTIDGGVLEDPDDDEDDEDCTFFSESELEEIAKGSFAIQHVPASEESNHRTAGFVQFDTFAILQEARIAKIHMMPAPEPTTKRKADKGMHSIGNDFVGAMKVQHDDDRHTTLNDGDEATIPNVTTKSTDSDYAALLIEDKLFSAASKRLNDDSPRSVDDGKGVEIASKTSKELAHNDEGGPDAGITKVENPLSHYAGASPIDPTERVPLCNNFANLKTLNENPAVNASDPSPAIAKDADDEQESNNFPSLRGAKDRAKKALEDAKRRVTTARLQKHSEKTDTNESATDGVGNPDETNDKDTLSSPKAAAKRSTFGSPSTGNKKTWKELLGGSPITSKLGIKKAKRMSDENQSAALETPDQSNRTQVSSENPDQSNRTEVSMENPDQSNRTVASTASSELGGSLRDDDQERDHATGEGQHDPQTGPRVLTSMQMRARQRSGPRPTVSGIQKNRIKPKEHKESRTRVQRGNKRSSLVSSERHEPGSAEFTEKDSDSNSPMHAKPSHRRSFENTSDAPKSPVRSRTTHRRSLETPKRERSPVRVKPSQTRSFDSATLQTLQSNGVVESASKPPRRTVAQRRPVRDRSPVRVQPSHRRSVETPQRDRDKSPVRVKPRARRSFDSATIQMQQENAALESSPSDTPSQTVAQRSPVVSQQRRSRQANEGEDGEKRGSRMSRSPTRGDRRSDRAGRSRSRSVDRSLAQHQAIGPSTSMNENTNRPLRRAKKSISPVPPQASSTTDTMPTSPEGGNQKEIARRRVRGGTWGSELDRNGDTGAIKPIRRRGSRSSQLHMPPASSEAPM